MSDTSSRQDSTTTTNHTKTTPQKDVKTSKHATRYLIIGILVTAFNYLLFAILANLIIQDNNFIWLSNLIATSITTLVAYLAHSRITWKERHVTKHSVIRFFIWNALFAIAIGPCLTQLFSLLAPVYDFTYNVFQALHIPFSYEFVLTTGAFGFTAVVTMILNFLFYDKFVFGKPKNVVK